MEMSVLLKRTTVMALGLIGLIALSASPGGAQQPEVALAVLGGVSQYDLSGTGTTPFVTARLDLPIGDRFVLEPALSYMPYEPQFGGRTHHVLPEVQLQMQRTGETFRPYLGVGFGASQGIRSGEDPSDPTLSAATGARVVTLSGWLIRGELRVRVIDPWVGTTADWAIGVGRTF